MTDTTMPRVIRVAEIRDDRVIALLRSEGLGVDVAKSICKEVDYIDRNGTIVRGYGRENLAGGYSMITLAKGTINVGPGDVTIIEGDGTDRSTCLLFAGIRDAIAFVTLNGHPSCDMMVMFSTSFARKAAAHLLSGGYAQVLYYAPNSPGKDMSMPIITGTGLSVRDMSAEYVGFKDLRKYCSAKMNGRVTIKNRKG